jgi:formate dehydrogenase subunit beta
MNTVISVNNNDVLAAVRGFLRSLLESGTVESIFVPLETAFGAVVPALVTDPDQLESSNPLAPVMPINSSRAVSALTHSFTPSERENNGKQKNGRLGVVLRPCEIRALIELIKLKQVEQEEIILIGIDCPGTYELTDYLKSQQNGGFPLFKHLVAASRGESLSPSDTGLNLRPACQMCTQPVPEHADIHLHLFGVEVNQGIPVTLKDEIATDLEFLQANDTVVGNWNTVVEQLTETRNQLRKKELESIRNQLSSDGGMAKLFAACIRCHNCMTVCPICYCKTCLFKTKEFDHQPEHYLNAARHKGATRLLGDTLLFHLTRMNHMSLSCVNCGMCTSACPSDIPVGAIFSAVGAQVQAAFDYVPGRSLEEPLPLVTFQAEELKEVGETG